MGELHVLVSPSLRRLYLVPFIFVLTAFPTYTAAHQEDKPQTLVENTSNSDTRASAEFILCTRRFDDSQGCYLTDFSDFFVVLTYF